MSVLRKRRSLLLVLVAALPLAPPAFALAPSEAPMPHHAVLSARIADAAQRLSWRNRPA